MSKNKRDYWAEDLSRGIKIGDKILLLQDNITFWLDTAEAFYDAARSTIREYMENPDGKIHPVQPVGFLYRHAIELLLKAIVITGKRIDGELESFLQSHNLPKLWVKARAAIESLWGRETPKTELDQAKREYDQVEGWIKKFYAWDETGCGFRYPNKKGENTVTIEELGATAEPLYKWLYECASGMLDVYGTMEEVNESNW